MISLSFTVQGAAMGAVRQSRRDIWDPSPAVLRYRDWRDIVRAAYTSARNRHKGKLAPAGLAPDILNWVAYFPIPSSWPKKRQIAAPGQKHQTTPDKDNTEKAILDAIFKSDSRVYDGRATKRYDDGKGARVEVEMIWEDL